jgi:ACR3 family arsenite transporter
MSREKLERHQVWLYLIAILIGLATGGAAPGLAAAFEPLLWPGLALLLYATFTQAGLVELPASFKDGAFLSAALLGNFIVLPILVSGVLALVPDEPAIRLGLLLVLLVPCTDWFITFTHLAGGDLRRAIMITPVLLVAQMLLLPLYLWLFMGKEFMALVSTGRMAIVFAGVLILPLWLAWLTERWAKRHAGRAELVARIGRLQVEAVRNSMPVMGDILMACAAFLAGATVCGLVIGRAFRLPTPQARTLVFTLTTRNSFVVLPLALALPATLGTASVVIVFQSLIELFGMLALLWLVPRKLLPLA